jgi:hypothetical protein
MPFAYYARLNRTQQAIYRKSDAITEVRLPHPAALRPLVKGLEAALETKDRAPTQAATARLIDGLTGALGVPAVTVDVLAARPHARWGELHGLYTATPGRRAKIQLWMRTAKQRRVVAFRTYLRTLLHEVGHHLDYTYLRLADSFHTEGFYKRESSLFHQLVEARDDDAGGGRARGRVRSEHDYAALPVAERLARLERTPDEIAQALRGHTEARMSRAPGEGAWSARDVVCHLRDAEEHLAGWMRAVMEMDEPPLLPAGTADRWADERQYARQHTGEAWNAFSRRRDETLAFLRAVEAAHWGRGGRHARRGRLTLDGLVALMAWHDDNHLDQLRRALAGEP